MQSIYLSSALLLAAALHAAPPALVRTIPLNSTAITGAAANPQTNKVYVVDEANGGTVILDGASNTTLATIPFTAGGLPLYPAVNKSRNQYAIAGGFTGSVYDGATNTPLVNISGNPNIVGNSAFNSMALNEATNKLYSSMSGGVLVTDLFTGSINVFAVTFLKAGEICTVHSLTVNPTLNWVYALTQCQLASAVMFVFDGGTGANLQTVDLGGSIPFGADVVESALNLKSNKLYVANYGGLGINTQAPIPPSVEVYNASTLAHLASVPNVVGPLAVDSVLNAVYGISATGLGGALIDGSTDTLNSTFALGFPVSGVQAMPIAVNEATNMVYYLNTSGGSVSVFQGSLPSPGTFSITGQLSGSGAAGVTMKAQGGSTFTAVTNAAGSFTISGLPPGAYVVTPSTVGLFYAPAAQSVNITTASVTGVNFAALQIPITVQSLTLAPYTAIASGVTTNGTVTLNEAAPAGGVILNLSSSNAKIVKTPATAVVPAGSFSGTFAIQASGVNTPTPINITASYSGPLAAAATSASTGLTVSPNDSLHIQSATWSKSSLILKVDATSTNPQAVVTLFLASGNVNLGTFTNLGGGNFSIQVSFGSGTPASVNVRSNLGGATGQGVTVVP